MTSILESHPALHITPEVPGATIRVMGIDAEDAATYAQPLERVAAAAMHDVYVDRLGMVSAEELAAVVNPQNTELVIQRQEAIDRKERHNHILTAEIGALGDAAVVGVLYGSRAKVPPELWRGNFTTAALITDIFVDPAYENMGIGSLLTNRFLADFAYNQGVLAHILFSNNAARERTEQAGFKRHAIHPDKHHLSPSRLHAKATFVGPSVEDVRTTLAPTLRRHNLLY